MPLLGKLLAGVLTDIANRDTVTWADGGVDVTLSAMPSGRGPFGYDSVNQLAVSTARVKRTLFAIRADLVALSAGQKTNVWNAFIAGNPPLWSQDAGPNAAALAAIQMFGASATLSAADVLEAKIRAVMMYVQDNPTFLVTPAFDPTINILGDAPAP